MARGLVRKLQGLSSKAGSQPSAPLATAAAAPSVEFLAELQDVKALRRAVAAVGCPDEGMRGSTADVLKLQAAAHPSVIATLTRALRGRVAEAAAAAATVRSI